MTALEKRKKIFVSNPDPEKSDPKKPLTPQQIAFAKGWAQGETISGAATRAGYANPDYGFVVKKMPKVIAQYNIEKAKFEADNQMSRRKVMDGLIDGIETAKLLGEPASIINGWKTIGQMCGYFEPVKKTIDINVSGTVNMKKLESMSDADLLKLIKGEVTDVVFSEVENDDDAE